MIIQTNIHFYFIGFILFLLAAGKAFAIRFPEIAYFPLIPNHSYTLLSEKGNSVNLLLKIELSKKEDEVDNFFLNYSFEYITGKEKIFYILRFALLTNGDIYLTEIKDDVFTRSFIPGIMIFPQVVSYNTNYIIGENITFRHLKRIENFKDPAFKKSYKDVIISELKLLDKTILLYFSKTLGLVAIKTKEELFQLK